MIYSFDVERQLLAGLIKNPEEISSIIDVISIKDFYSEESHLHAAIFKIIKQAFDKREEIDEIIIAQRVEDLSMSFQDNVNPPDYIRSLALRKVPKGNLLKTAQELKKLTIRREISESSKFVAEKMAKLSSDASYSEIIELADSSFNKTINLYELPSEGPSNIFDKMEGIIEERGNNPITEFGMMGPHTRLNELYGSLLRYGNITCIVARSGVGKSTWTSDYCIKTSSKYDVPVLHLDNGEMSEEETIMRQCAALSGVPMHLLETGNWRKAGPEVVEKVRAVWPKVKKLKFYYENVGGLTVDEMIAMIRRFYYANVGRGNKMILSFDYIKTSAETANKSEHQVVGEMVDKFKRFIQKEMVHEKEPQIAMMTSVQSNRTGITTNRSADSVLDDESTISLSDRIIQFASHMFILREKTLDEIQNEGYENGTHKLINLKRRHLGEDIKGALEPVKIGDSLRKNCVFFEFNNFGITEKGDLRVVANALNGIHHIDNDDDNDSLPDMKITDAK